MTCVHVSFQFPNGRWGNQASPAFGDLDTLVLSLPQKPQDAINLWGTPQSVGDVAELFARFCKGELKSLPWSDQPAAKETSRIAEQLAKINQLGFLTVSNFHPLFRLPRVKDGTDTGVLIDQLST